MTEEIGFGPHRLRLRQSKADLWEGIIVGRAKERIAAPTRGSLLGKLQAAAMAGTRGYIGLDDARHRFLRIYPDGFSDPNYLGQGDLGMRGRIVALAERTQSDLPGQGPRDSCAAELASELLSASELPDTATRTFLCDLLRGPKASQFLEIAAEFGFGSVTRACERMAAEFPEDKADSWVSLTHFAFLWRPEAHAFLKLDAAKRFAERIGDPFQYACEPFPNPATYLECLRMTRRVWRAVADLGPQDNIDLHCFMHATATYSSAEVARLAGMREN